MKLNSYHFDYYKSGVLHYIPCIMIYSVYYKRVKIFNFTVSLKFLKYGVLLDLDFDMK
jgi:hypothetical protein